MWKASSKFEMCSPFADACETPVLVIIFNGNAVVLSVSVL